MRLDQAGWNKELDKKFIPYRERGLLPGRVIKESRGLYSLITEAGEIRAEVSGHFHYFCDSQADFPVTGDWVAIRGTGGEGLIEEVLPRSSVFSRKASGSAFEEQVIAANIHTLCIVSGLDGGRNFNLRGIERYMAMAVSGGANPRIVLNKADMCADRETSLLQASGISREVPVHMVSALTGEGIEELRNCFALGETIALTGPSGVGKSALTNALAAAGLQKTGAQREDDRRGRHTTTHRELFLLPGGALLIDTPGLRELQPWGDGDSVADTFADIHEASAACRFSDCSHTGEPGCNVQLAVAEGRIEAARLQNYLDMQGEISYLESKRTEKGRREKKRKEKNFSKMVKEVKRFKKQDGK